MTKDELIASEVVLKDLWEQGKIRVPVHFSGGNEDKLLEIFKEVHDGDYIFSSHRNHYHYYLSGGSVEDLVKELTGDMEVSRCRAKSGSMAYTDVSRHFYSTAIVAGSCAIATGVAWALKQKGSKAKVWCFIGDGAIDNGHFWEALQYAQGYDLPIVFVIEDNDRSTCSSVKDRLGDQKLTARDMVMVSNKCWYYYYKATFEHVGSSKYVQF